MTTLPNKQKYYLENRWQSQRDYYSRQAARNKRWHLALMVFTSLTSISVPILLNVPNVPKLIPTVLSGLVAMAAALENVYHFGDNWRNFRRTLEALKRERMLFEMGVGPYKNPERAFDRFVRTVENLIAEENRAYFPERSDKDQEKER